MKRLSIIFTIAIMSVWNHEASAFWGSGSTDAASGLNVTAGFDVNTITTITGTTITTPEHKGQDQHTVMSVATSQGTVTAVLGPWWYWEKQTVTIANGQEISITGSLAQGKDGTLYVFAQRLENLSNGETITLRSESGKPLWSHSGSGNKNGGGMRYGAGNRGGVMRGGRR